MPIASLQFHYNEIYKKTPESSHVILGTTLLYYLLDAATPLSAHTLEQPKRQEPAPISRLTPVTQEQVNC